MAKKPESTKLSPPTPEDRTNTTPKNLGHGEASLSRAKGQRQIRYQDTDGYMNDGEDTCLAHHREEPCHPTHEPLENFAKRFTAFLAQSWKIKRNRMATIASLDDLRLGVFAESGQSRFRGLKS